jgi:hypothetical protein
MLELHDGQKLTDELWNATTVKVEMSETFNCAFFQPRGPVAVSFDNKRAYHRYYMRGRAVLQRSDSTLGVYTKDISRQGIAFLSPEQLLPKERVTLCVRSATIKLEVTRCRRLDTNCFECGAKFAL